MAAIGSRLLTLEIDSVEYSAVITNVRLAPTDASSDTVTYADAAGGGAKDWHLSGTAIQDLVADSFWRKCFDSAGTTVTYTLSPYGNAVASAAEPQLTGSVVIGQLDGDVLGGDADVSATKRQTFDFDWVCTAKPTIVEA